MSPILGVARDGWPIVGAFALFAAGVWAASSAWLAWWALVPGVAATVLAGWCIWFFRDPERRVPAEGGALISPADGVICAIGPAVFTDGPVAPETGTHTARRATRVSVFMNVFDVHVNRSPVAARVARVGYTPGRFINASLDKASEHNERCAIALELDDGRTMTVVQIAGLVARRIVCRVREGARLAAGERFGMIRFGSRVDVYLPAGVEPAVVVGDRVRAGESVIARPVALPAVAPPFRAESPAGRPMARVQAADESTQA